jgi:phage tail-like protein
VSNLIERPSSLPPSRVPGDYHYLEQVVCIGFPVMNARTYLNRHLGNTVHYKLTEAQRGESVGVVRAVEVEPHLGGDNILIQAIRTLPDGTPASYFTPEDLVETRAVVESDTGGPVPPLRPRDRIILHVPVRSYLRFLPGLYQGAVPTTRQDLVKTNERSIRQWGARDELTVTEVQSHDADQFRRFLFLFQHLMTTVTDKIDRVPSLTNPMTADPAFLPWVASWVNFALDESLPLHQQRELVRRSIRLHRTRGTRAGIEEMIRVLTSAPVTVVERRKPFPTVLGGMFLSGGRNIEERYQRAEPPGHFIVGANRKHGTFFVLCLEDRKEFRQRFGERAGPVLRRITHIVTTEKPAHVSFTIQFGAEASA